MLRNKKGDIAVTVLTVLTLVFVILTLFLFNIRDKDMNIEIGRNFVIDEILSKEEIINFNIQNIVDMVSKDANSKENFINNFKVELGKYKDSNGRYFISELEQLEEQIVLENVVYENGKFSIDFNILVEKEVLKDGKRDVFISYEYKKTFINK